MRTYVIDGITIEIGAQIVCIRHEGKTITPKEKRKTGPVTAFKRIVEEFWKNGYFKSRTKAHLAVKGAEVAARCFGAHAIYMLVSDQLWPTIAPYIPIVLEVWDRIDLATLAVQLDLGFLLGMVTTAVGIYFKRKTYELLKGDVYHEKTK